MAQGSRLTAQGERLEVQARLLVFAVVAAGTVAVGAGGTWQVQPSGTTERLRAVSVVSDTVAWASGNKGTVLRTADGGAHWSVLAVPGADGLDFRDIEAITDSTAYILSIGPGDKSRIYKTTDAGGNWTLQFTNPDPRAFYDAIAFWDDQNGLAVGDPVDGRFTVLRTTNGGNTWSLIPEPDRPAALPGDGMFAASGTCLTVQSPTKAWIGTGGAARARVLRTTDRGLTWSEAATPIVAGTPSAGIFSVAFSDAMHGLIVGGDYRKEQESSDNLAVSDDGGRTWVLAGGARLRGFRSGVVFIPGSGGREAIAVGPAGTDRSTDGGHTWFPVGDVGFHAVGVGRSGASVWAAGEQGRVGRLVQKAAGQHLAELRGADTKYRYADWNYTWANGAVVDLFYVGVPGSNELNVGGGYAFKRGCLVLTPLVYAVIGKEGGQRGVKVAVLVSVDKDGWKLLSFLGHYIPGSGDVASYQVLDTLDATRAIGTRWEAGLQAGFFRSGGAWNPQVGPLVKLNDGHGAWAASYRFGPQNEFRVGRVVTF